MKLSIALNLLPIVGSLFAVDAQVLRGNERRGLSTSDPLPKQDKCDPELDGFFTIKQESTQNFLDAPAESVDFNVFAEPSKQNDGSQDWDFSSVGTIYRIQNRENNEFMDAFGSSNNGLAVTRTFQGFNDQTQLWAFFPEDGAYRVQQIHSRRFLDADEAGNFNARTRANPEDDDSQLWITNKLSDGSWTIKHKINDRFLAVQAGSQNIVTRSALNSDSQKWDFIPVGSVYTIQNKNSGQFLDNNGNNVVTRESELDDSQKWVVLEQEGINVYTIQQLASRHFLDAFESSPFNAVKGGAQNDSTQRWILEEVV